MHQIRNINDIHCNDCQYEGPAKTNSANSFIIFFIMLCSSVVLLPMIVVALGFMAWIIATPAKLSCPQCKSKNIVELTDEQMKALNEPKNENTPE